MNPSLSSRQWVILQQALLTYLDHLESNDDAPFVRWDAADGPMPDEAEIDALATLVGSLPVARPAPELRLYHFRQNNIGGTFVTNERVDQHVFIEAGSCGEANELAELVGIYFDGCETGRDCSCCGDRWHPQRDDEDDVVSEDEVLLRSARRVYRYDYLTRLRNS